MLCIIASTTASLSGVFWFSLVVVQHVSKLILTPSCGDCEEKATQWMLK